MTEKMVKRALWLARAIRACEKSEILNERSLLALPEYRRYWRDKCRAWIRVEELCRKKADSCL